MEYKAFCQLGSALLVLHSPSHLFCLVPVPMHVCVWGWALHPASVMGDISKHWRMRGDEACKSSGQQHPASGCDSDCT